ncbi:MAG: exosome complex RNA-binding protein Csl4 [archaeon GB-1867-005]|nr:exosome complex RNA-binding protein Csl4 [Candidatus Culexmicrobium cathedralense]
MQRFQGKFVLPGEFLAVIEEFIPGDGTYEENGNIYSARAGMVRFDLAERVISVAPYKGCFLPLPREGDVALGVVYDVKDEIAIVRMYHLEGKGKLSSYLTGFLHISQLSIRKKFRSMFDAVRLGDWVRVKVLNSWTPYQLSMRGSKLGVLLAKCTRCLSPLIRRRDRLFCQNCRAYESRKIAADYGGLILEAGR